MDAYTITGITAYIRSVLDQDEILRDIWIKGEVSNMRQYSSGHWYFTLKDTDAQLKCVMFRSDAAKQAIQPQDGDLVQVHGRISVYEARGDYQLYADQIQTAGAVGDLYQRFDALKQQLFEEGLFEDSLKQPLPRFPRQIGVVTSPDAAAFRDIQHVLRRRYPLAAVILSPTLVQGTTAPPQIVRAIERLNAHTQVDVILVCRGGGSIEDLWCFNDESVARAVVASQIPIVSGVGHETDFTIVDFVADVRAPTPSAAAEVVTPDQVELRSELQRQQADLLRIMQDHLTTHQSDLSQLQHTLARESPAQYIASSRQHIDDLTERMEISLKRQQALLRERLSARRAALNAASPESILARGYAIVSRTEDDRIVMDETDAPPGTGITIRLKDSELTARTEDKDTHGRYKRTLF